MCQNPDANGKAQKEDSQVERVEPELKQVFHFDFSWLIFLDRIVHASDLPSPGRGEWTGDFSYF